MEVVKIYISNSPVIKINIGQVGTPITGDFATNSALNAEIAARQAADQSEQIARSNLNTALSNQIASEQSTRQNADAYLQQVQDDHIANHNNPHIVTLEQARSASNIIQGNIDANGKKIINLPAATSSSEPVTKAQLDALESTVVKRRGSIDCSANPNLPASNAGDRWEVSVAGKIGGASGRDVDVYNEIVCLNTSPAGTWSAQGSNFYIIQGDVEYASETVTGYLKLASDSETQAGSENTKAITALKLANWWTAVKAAVITFAAKITFTSAPRFNSVSASTILEVDTNKDLVGAVKGTAYNKNFGSASGDVCQGNDSRLSDQRTPSDGSVTLAKFASIAALTYLGNDTGSAIAPKALTRKELRESLGIFEKFTTQTRTNATNTMGDVDASDLSVTLKANTSYKFKMRGRLQCNNTGGSSLGLSVPSGSTVDGEWNNNSTGSTNFRTSFATGGTVTTSTFATVANTDCGFWIEGIITTSSTAGDLRLQFKSITNGQTTTIYSRASVEVIEFI